MGLVNSPTKFEIRPTCFIGFGGSGSNTLKQTYLYLNEHFDVEASRYLQFMFIDTDSIEKVVQNGDVPERYFHHYYYENLSDLINDASNKGITENRLPKYLGRNPLNRTDEGAGICRIFGMLSFLNNIDGENISFRRTLEAMLRDVKQGEGEKIVSDSNYNILDDPLKIRIYFVGSNAGGTASGSLIDAIAFTRHYCFQKGYHVVINAVILEPGPFVNDSKISKSEVFNEEIMANAYAFKKELMYYSINPFEFQQSPGLNPTKTSKESGLIDHIYLVDSSGFGNQIFLSRADDAYHSAAEMLFHFAVSPVGSNLDSIAPNQRKESTKLYPFETVEHAEFESGEVVKRLSRRKLFSSFGVSSLRIPSQLIVNYLVNQYAHKLIESFSGSLSKVEEYTEIDNDIQNIKKNEWGLEFVSDIKLLIKNSFNDLRGISLDTKPDDPFNYQTINTDFSNEIANEVGNIDVRFTEGLNDRIRKFEDRSHPIFKNLINNKEEDTDYGIRYIYSLLNSIEALVFDKADEFQKIKSYLGTEILNLNEIDNTLKAWAASINWRSKLSEDCDDLEKDNKYLKIVSLIKIPLLTDRIVSSAHEKIEDFINIRNYQHIAKSIFLKDNIERYVNIYHQDYIIKIQSIITEQKKAYELYLNRINSLKQRSETILKNSNQQLKGFLIFENSNSTTEKYKAQSFGEAIYSDNNHYNINRRVKVVFKEILTELESLIFKNIQENLIFPFARDGFIYQGKRMRLLDICKSDIPIIKIFNGVKDFVKKQYGNEFDVLNGGFNNRVFSSSQHIIEQLANQMYRNAAPLLNFKKSPGLGAYETEYIIGAKNSIIDIKEIFTRYLRIGQSDSIRHIDGTSDEYITIIRIVHCISPNTMRNILKQWRAYRKWHVDNCDPGDDRLGNPLHIFSNMADKMPELFTYELDKYPFVDHKELISLAKTIGVIKINNGNAWLARPDGQVEVKNGNGGRISFHGIRQFHNILENEAIKLLNKMDQIDLATEIIDECVYQLAWACKDQEAIISKLNSKQKRKLSFLLEQLRLERHEI